MFVCGGSSTWRNVCCGVVNWVRRRRRPAGRHFAKAPRSTGLPPKPPPPFPPAPPEEGPVPFLARNLSMQACIASNCLAVGRGMFRWNRNVCPPVFSFATILGTTPSWCSARSVNPDVTCATFASEATCFAADCRNVSCEPGRKKSWTKCVPALPSFERSVSTDWFAATRSELPPPGPPPNPPWFCCGDSVTVRSVPMPPSGFSVFFCARSRPADRLAIAITSATPSPSPSSVTIVRPRRRNNSFRR